MLSINLLKTCLKNNYNHLIAEAFAVACSFWIPNIKCNLIEDVKLAIISLVVIRSHVEEINEPINTFIGHTFNAVMCDMAIGIKTVSVYMKKLKSPSFIIPKTRPTNYVHSNRDYFVKLKLKPSVF